MKLQQSLIEASERLSIISIVLAKLIKNMRQPTEALSLLGLPGGVGGCTSADGELECASSCVVGSGGAYGGTKTVSVRVTTGVGAATTSISVIDTNTISVASAMGSCSFEPSTLTRRRLSEGG
jgi:hypothetical protein